MHTGVRSFCFTRRSLILWYCGKTIHPSEPSKDQNIWCVFSAGKVSCRGPIRVLQREHAVIISEINQNLESQFLYWIWSMYHLLQLEWYLYFSRSSRNCQHFVIFRWNVTFYKIFSDGRNPEKPIWTSLWFPPVSPRAFPEWLLHSQSEATPPSEPLTAGSCVWDCSLGVSDLCSRLMLARMLCLQQPQHHQGGCYQDGNLRILESIHSCICLCKNLKIVIF